MTKFGHLGINAQAVLIRKVSAGSFSTKSMYKMPLFIILCKISKQKQSYIQALQKIHQVAKKFLLDVKARYESHLHKKPAESLAITMEGQLPSNDMIITGSLILTFREDASIYLLSLLLPYKWSILH